MSEGQHEILHESTGLRIRRNHKNRMIVVRLHYMADPNKRSAQWEAEARAGMKTAAFEKEYDIRYDALYGEKVFPAISTCRDKIIVPQPHPTFPEHQVYYAGMDYGERNPSAFIVFAEFDQVRYAIWELYEPAPDINAFAAKMVECPYWPKLKYVVADPHIFNNTSHQNGVACTVASHFQRAGIKNIMPGKQGPTTEPAWRTMMHTFWESEDPTFRIFNNCQNLIREFEGALYKSQSDHQLQTANYVEAMVDNNNHAMDATKYYMLARPPAGTPSEAKPGSKGRLGGVMCRW